MPGGFGGSAQNMINTIKYNKYLLGVRKNVFEQLKDYEGSNGGKKLKFKKASEAELRIFKQEWGLKLQEMRKRKLMALSISIVIACCIMYGIISLF